MNKAYQKRLVELAKEVDELFAQGTINQKKGKAEIDLAHLSKLWQLLGFIMVLDTEEEEEKGEK
jgi:hypothetical protein